MYSHPAVTLEEGRLNILIYEAQSVTVKNPYAQLVNKGYSPLFSLPRLCTTQFWKLCFKYLPNVNIMRVWGEGEGDFRQPQIARIQDEESTVYEGNLWFHIISLNFSWHISWVVLFVFFFIFPTVTTRIEVHSFLYMFCSIIMPLEHVLRDGVKSSPEEIVGADTFELGRNGGHRDQRA